MSIIIYTDGSAKGNPGNGGYGIVMMSGDHRRELHQGFRLTTNNRMELLAVIIALESVKKENSIITILLPNIGEGIDEVEVTEINVKVDDVISTTDSIITVETEKASMDIPAKKSGIIKNIFGIFSFDGLDDI